jgi:hypothetical protein
MSTTAAMISGLGPFGRPSRINPPDILVLVKTDITPMNGWMLKEGNRYGDDVPVLNGGYCYTEGQLRLD